MSANEEKYKSAPAHFSVRSLFLLTFGFAAAIALFASPHPTTRAMGWLGLAVFLFCRRQQTLFWMHLAIPAFLGLVAFMLGDEDSFFKLGGPSHRAVWAQRGTWIHLFHCMGDAGMFLSFVTLPFSVLRVDGKRTGQA